MLVTGAKQDDTPAGAVHLIEKREEEGRKKKTKCTNLCVSSREHTEDPELLKANMG